MPSNHPRLQYLLQQYLRDTGTPDELREFWKLFRELEEENPLKEELWQLWYGLDTDKSGKKGDWDKVEQRIQQQITAWQLNQRPSFIRRSGRRFVAAAAVFILLIGIGIYFLIANKSSVKLAQTETQVQRFKNDVSPGGNRAILTLANGSTIILDSAQNGTLIQQGHTKVLKQKNGELAYESDEKNQGNKGKKAERAHSIMYNTLSTPRGGQYKLTLPDGTKVWLNSASSIRFPSAFGGEEREVEITGEVYFEVTHRTANLLEGVGNQEDIPFIVDVNGMKVKVLGTHFNINAYNDEATIKTTLLQGSVKVIQGGHQRTLVPGQQAQLNHQGKIALVENINLEEVMAWKNGYFQFQNDSISTIMRQVARWYDVDIIYHGNVSQLFIGKVPRSVNVSTLFKILESTGWVHFMINGREITVEP